MQNPLLVAGVLALETARLTDSLDTLRTPDAPWPARATREAQNQVLADGDPIAAERQVRSFLDHLTVERGARRTPWRPIDAT